MDTLPFIPGSKKIKCLEINLTKGVDKLHTIKVKRLQLETETLENGNTPMLMD